jgi:diguanylate cyclase (GGDEF)-like protein/PAS domain S-box-containing protein
VGEHVVADTNLDPYPAAGKTGTAPSRPVFDAARLLQHVDTALCAADGNGRLLTMTGAITEITALAPSTYVGTFLSEHIHPDDIQSVEDDYRRLRFGADGTRAEFRIRIRTATGGWRWVEIVATRLLDEPGFNAFVASLRDAEDEQLEVQRLRDSADATRRQIDGLQRQDAFLSALVAVSADMVAIADDDLDIKWITSDSSAITGWNADQVVGRSIWSMVHPDDRESAARELASEMGPIRGVARPLTCRILMSDGGYRWMRATGKDMRGVPWVDGVVLCLVDVHEATVAQEELDATQRRFAALVQSSHDGIAIIDADGRAVYVSPASKRMLGWTPEELCGSLFTRGIPEDDLSRAGDAFVAAVEDPSRPQVVQIQVSDREEHRHWLELTFWSHLDDPDVQGVVVNFRDVTDQRRLVSVLEERSRALESLAFSSSTGLFEQDTVNGITHVNERFVEIAGQSAEECMGQGFRKLLDTGVVEGVPPLVEASSGDQDTVRFPFTRPDGDRRWVDLRYVALPMEPDGLLRRYGGIEDVTAIVEAEESLMRLAEVFDLTDDPVLLIEPYRPPLYMNQAAKEILGEDGNSLVSHPDLQEVWEAVETAFQDPEVNLWAGEVTLRSGKGAALPMSVKVMAHRRADGYLQYVSVVARDISERIEMEAILERQATHDPLTGLPNRALLLERIRKTIVEGSGGGSALLFIDLDHFKVINDSLGHSLGDQLLRAIAARILVVIRPGDTVARFGGDEFVVLCEDLSETEDALRVAHRVETSLQAPFDVDGHEIHVGVSIGIAFSDEEDPDPVAILRDADTAMYEAKAAGRGRWVVFDDDLRTRAVRRQQIESELRQSRSGDNLCLHYQPVMDLRTGTIRGVEALLRWQRDGELVAPELFVTVAEETGLIVPIGTWALEQACEQAVRWQRELPGWADIGMAVNVSARQLQRPGFLSTVSEVIASSGIAEGTLTIEITESVLLDDTAATAALLSALREMSVHVAVDDFGTGYSSLTYLHRLPVDAVKLDRSFVAGVADDVQRRAIVTAVLNLAGALGLQSVAEGIETERQLAELRLLGCIAGQGYLISPAVDAETLTTMLRDGFTM